MWRRSFQKLFMVTLRSLVELEQRIWVDKLTLSYTTMVQPHKYDHRITSGTGTMPKHQESASQKSEINSLVCDGGTETTRLPKPNIGENVSRKEKYQFLVKTLLDLENNKEAVYGTLDAWIAWEQRFPIGSLRRALVDLEKEQQWHRIIQVIKWMLSKGQGRTMGTYSQLIRALDMDRRAEEAHRFWVKKIGDDLHSVPWQLCSSMIAIYYRNNMLGHLVKLFKGLEAFDRKPPEKSIVQKVADAYEMLGSVEEKERVLDKYRDLFSKTKGDSFKYRKSSTKKGGKK